MLPVENFRLKKPETIHRNTTDVLKYPFTNSDFWIMANLRETSLFSRQCFRHWFGKQTNMMNVDNKDVSSLMSPCKMRDFSSFNLLFCIINNLEKYQLSFVIQRRKLLRLSLPVLTPKFPLQNPCNTIVKYRVPELLLLWAVGTGGEC